ncbi:hypothetical protein KP509_26G021500 [Ceratopteris richardii]|nr:hypothetical protein KP509_26G021500 [Ceratopteris richardii]
MFQNKIQKDIAQDKANRVIHPDDLNRHCSEMLNGNRNAEASEVLWIGFPLHLKIDEKKLHKLFAPFGGVEKITTFPGRTYAFVRFQNVKAASRAKDALQGKLFDDPRVSISFAKSEAGSVDNLHVNSEICPPSSMKVVSKVPSVKEEEGSSMHPSHVSCKAGFEADRYSTVAKVEETSCSPSIPSLTSHSDPLRLPIATLFSSSSFLPSRPGIGVSESPYSPSKDGIESKGSTGMQVDVSGIASVDNKLKDGGKEQMHIPHNENIAEEKEPGERWLLHENRSDRSGQKRQRLETEADGRTLSSLTLPSGTNDRVQLIEEDTSDKRQRVGNEHPWSDVLSNNYTCDSSLPGNSLVQGMWEDQKVLNTGLVGRLLEGKKQEVKIPISSEGISQGKDKPLAALVGRVPAAESRSDQPVGSQIEHGLPESPISPARTDVGSTMCAPFKDSFRWEGAIAKGGIEVCRCRCFPATKEVGIMFPEVLNCTAKASLEMLANHISKVKDFAVVLFMPQGVSDVASYQDLLAFLVDKQRAAVCYLPEGRTLFLVPPSDFVEQFLNVPKSNNILGVVLGQQQCQVSSTSACQLAPNSQQTIDAMKHRQQNFDGYAIPKESVVFPAHSSAEVRAIKSSSPQQIGYHPECGRIDHGLSAPFVIPGNRNWVGVDASRGNDVVVDSTRVSYVMQGNKSSKIEQLTHETTQLPDIRNLPFQTSGSGSIPLALSQPMAGTHGLYMFGVPNIRPSGNVLTQPVRPMFFPRNSEQPPAPFTNHERPWSGGPLIPQSLPLNQSNVPPKGHLQTSPYGSTPLQQQPSQFYVQQSDGQVHGSLFSSRFLPANTRTVSSPYSIPQESVMRPPSPSPGLLPLASGPRPSIPSTGIATQQAGVSRDPDKQTSEADRSKVSQLAQAVTPSSELSEEEQKKFRATVELAAALLQQLQQTTKL